MKRTLATALTILVAAPPLTPAIAQDRPLSLVLQPTVGCMVAGANPRIDAGISPADQVQTGRVYFKSALGTDFFYVVMTPSPTGYQAILPKPLPGAGPITYYVEGLSRSFSTVQTSDENAIVVNAIEECKDRVPAAVVQASPIQVFSTTGLTTLPAGFSGISSVVAGAAGAASAAATTAGAAAAGGAFLGGTAGVVAVAAVLAGVTTVIIVNNNDSPASPSR